MKVSESLVRKVVPQIEEARTACARDLYNTIAEKTNKNMWLSLPLHYCCCTRLQVLESGGKRQEQEFHKLRHGFMTKVRGVVTELRVVHLDDESSAALVNERWGFPLFFCRVLFQCGERETLTSAPTMCFTERKARLIGTS